MDPESAPRTEWLCQPVAAHNASSVVPPGCRNSVNISASLDEARTAQLFAWLSATEGALPLAGKILGDFVFDARTVAAELFDVRRALIGLRLLIDCLFRTIETSMLQQLMPPRPHAPMSGLDGLEI
jgi:hypothetical protein